ncbi:MAG: hypothetical protein JW822_13530 [Spirochaetales bacterium]|nr:hypothetical protein [Spirochaetales bacterium]
MRLILCALCLSVLSCLLFFNCGNSPQSADGLAVTAHTPQIDGVVTQDEYSFKKEYAQCTLYAARKKQSVSFALVAQTTGWVSLGLGSKVMNNAHIIIGFVKDGRPQFKEQIGVGHGHEDLFVTESVVTDVAVKETDNLTTLEVELQTSGFIKDGQEELQLIIGYSGQDSFTDMHSFRQGVVLKLK